jgi:putative redox protein
MKELKVSFPGGVKVDVAFKGHLIRTDQPVSEGGEGSAPSPFDLFLASLAACAGYYLLAFCQARSLATRGAGLTMSYERNPQTKLVDRIEIMLQLPPGFPERYTPAVIKAVDACTVKAHLFNPPAFSIVAQKTE